MMAKGEHILGVFFRTMQIEMERTALIINRAENTLTADMSSETPF